VAKVKRASYRVTKVNWYCPSFPQAELDALRKKLNAVRESIREKHLAKERAEAERIRLQEEAQSPVGGRDSKTKKGKKKK
jgi:regulator of protease activity HflC (stomatin/prohibitin superfamily)